MRRGGFNLTILNPGDTGASSSSLVVRSRDGTYRIDPKEVAIFANVGRCLKVAGVMAVIGEHSGYIKE